MKTIESLTYQKILALLGIKYRNDAIEFMVHCIAEIFDFQSTFFLPITSDNRYLSYVAQDRSEFFNEIVFALGNFKHPFSQVVYEKEVQEIEAQDLWGWQYQSEKFNQLITIENLENGLVIIPLYCGDEDLHGCLVISLIDYRKQPFNEEPFQYFLKIAAQHLKNIEDLRFKEDEEIYLTRSIAKSERTYLDYLKKLQLQESIVAYTPVMKSIVSKMAQIIDSNVSVLFSGATGTGKTYLAQILKSHSQRSRRAFIIVDCEENQTLAEEDFFGKGGFLARSKNGTLLLENITFLSKKLQQKLVSVFLKGSYLEIETGRRYKYNARVLSTTKESPSDLIKRKLLRPDFFTQVSQIIFSLPDLKERKSDFKSFVDLFISQFNARKEKGKNVIGYNNQFLKEILHLDWAENLHTFQTYMEERISDATDGVLRGHVGLGQSEIIQRKLLIENFVKDILDNKYFLLNEVLTEVERLVLKRELENNGGKRQLVADKLNLPLRTLAYKCQKHGL